jgi:cysteine-rich repeat protein
LVAGETDTFVVRNVGCPPGWPTSGGALADCISPGAPTAVEVWVSFGDVLGIVHVSDSSSVALHRGESSPGVYSWGSSTVTKTGGWSGSLMAYDSSTVTMSGGTVPSLDALEFSAVTMSGGTADSLLAYGSSTIKVVGTDFAVDGVPVPYGNLTALTGTLTGTLASGDPIDASLRQGGGNFTGTITLAPEACGDNFIEGAEQCDDANTTPGDGCDEICQIETGWNCADEPSICAKQLPTLSPWSQLALMAGLLGAGLSVWRGREWKQGCPRSWRLSWITKNAT